MGSHQKLNYIHVFRALAILLIVAGHASSTSHPLFAPLKEVLLKDGTVLFVFISGFLFQYLSNEFCYGKYLKKKFFNIICPYLATSVVGILWLFASPSGNPFHTVNKLVQIPMFLTTGYYHNLPTWYIPMTCVFFGCAAGLLKAEKKYIFAGKSLLFCLLPFLLCFTLFIPREPLSVLRGVGAWESFIHAVKTVANLTVLFFPVYVLGMFFAAHREYIKLTYKYRKWLLVALGVAGVVAFTGLYGGFVKGRLLAPKLILTLVVLGYLEHYDQQIMQAKRVNRILDILATYSFAIFFLHWYVKIVFDFVWRKDVSLVHINALEMTGIRFAVMILGSLLLAFLLKKMLTLLGIKNTRWFIGV